jgi:hypothetical protein
MRCSQVDEGDTKYNRARARAHTHQHQQGASMYDTKDAAKVLQACKIQKKTSTASKRCNLKVEEERSLS